MFSNSKKSTTQLFSAAALEMLESRRLLSTTTYVSDLQWTSATNGFGDVALDKAIGTPTSSDGMGLRINGKAYTKGLGVHAPSDVTYTLAGQYLRFQSDIGIDDRQDLSGTVVFQVYADGKKIYDSGLVTGKDATASIDLDVSGVNKLRLVVTDGRDGITNDHADWGGARLTPFYGGGNGLKAEYYDNADLSDIRMIRTDPRVDYNWGANAPDNDMDGNSFSVRWSGQVRPTHDETYTFTAVADDGVRLWVNGKMLIDNWINPTTGPQSGTIALQAGVKYDIKMCYYENTGNAEAHLLWSSDSQKEQIIPKSQLFSDAVTTQEFKDAPVSTNSPATVQNSPSGPAPTVPIGPVTITVDPNGPVSTISQAVDIAKPGDTVLIKNGVYHESMNLNTSGTADARISFVAQTNGGVIIDGGYITGGAQYITLKGITVRNTRNMLQNENAAIRIGSNWFVQNVTAENCTGQGWAVMGNNVILVNVIGQDNGHNGGGGDSCHNVLVYGGYVARNNRGVVNPPWAGQQYTLQINGLWYVNPVWEAGGEKWSLSDNVTLNGHDAMDNGGVGIWFDIYNTNMTVENCEVAGNVGIDQSWEGIGISTEISDGPALITNNFVHDNTGEGISIWESFGATIRNNVLDNDEIGFRNLTDRGSYHVANAKVYGNKFYGNSPSSILLWDGMTPSYLQANNVQIGSNQFNLPGNPD